MRLFRGVAYYVSAYVALNVAIAAFFLVLLLAAGLVGLLLAWWEDST